MESISLHQLQEMIVPFDKMNDNHIVNDIFCILIDKNDIKANAKTFADINDCAAKRIVWSIASIIHNPRNGDNLKKKDNTMDHLFFSNHTPKVMLYLEKLITHRKEFVGYRLWIMILDAKFKLDEGFSNLVKENNEWFSRKKDSRRKNKGGDKSFILEGDGVDFSDRNDPKIYIGHRSITSVEKLVNENWGPLSRGRQEIVNIDQLHGEDNPICEKGSCANPETVLEVSRSFSANLDVCDLQDNINNYFNGEGENGYNASNYKRTFPIPKNVFRINAVYFSPLSLHKLPFPDIASSQLIDVQEQLETINQRIEQVNAYLMAEDNEIERSRAEDERDVLLLNKKSLEQTIKTIVSEYAETDFGGKFMSGMDIEQVCAQRNVFMQLAAKNEEKLRDINAKYDKDTSEYRQAMSDFVAIGVREFMEAFRTSDVVTQPTKDGRNWYSRQPNEKKFVENLQVCKDLSLFANVMIGLIVELDKVFAVETNFQAIIIGFLTLLCSSRFSWKLRPNLLLSGEAAGGKSFIFDWLESVSVPGATMNITHLTPQAMNGNQDISDVFIIIHEANMSMLGKDEHGNDKNSDPTMKNRLTKQIAVTCAPKSNSDTRTTEMSVSRCMGGYAIASNDRQPGEDSAMMSRFIKHRMTKKNREGVDPNAIPAKSQFAENEQITDITRHGLRLCHFYVFMVEKAIEAKALGVDVNTDGARLVASWVFNELKKQGVPPPPRRQVDMYVDMARVLTIWSSIQILVFGELGLQYRQHVHQDGSITYKQFDEQVLIDLRPWLCTTQEQSIFVLTLMESVFVPNFKGDLASAVAGGLHRWPPRKEDTIDKFRTTYINNEERTDFRYVGIEGTSWRQIVTRFRGHMDEMPSTNDVLDVLHTMQSENICSRNYGWLESDKDATNPLLQYDASKTAYFKVRDCDSDGVNDVDDALGHLTSKGNGILAEIELLSLDEPSQPMQIDNPPTSKFNFANSRESLVKESTIADNKKYTWIKYGKSEEIPCVVFEDDKKNKVKKIYIAVALIGVKLNEVFKNCIPKALQHAMEPERTYISGFPYVEIPKDTHNVRGIDLLKKKKKIIHYNLFDTINIPHGKTFKVIYNSFRYNDLEEAILNRRVIDKSKKNMQLSTFQKRSASIADKPIDEIHMLTHWREGGMDPEDDNSILCAYPPIGHAIVWRLRESEKRYEEFQDKLIESYPQSFLDEQKKSEEQYKEICNAAKEAEADLENAQSIIHSFNYSDIAGTYAQSRSINIDTSSFYGNMKNTYTKNSDYLSKIVLLSKRKHNGKDEEQHPSKQSKKSLSLGNITSEDIISSLKTPKKRLNSMK